ncbi:flagellar basal body P-ring formation chaperone FlgA [Methylocella sp.]|uniref:flagellar basal body P-ring formation chaperone FlgA n=1 Tax=Methylocella sp. TaxID=1978226 RepID=UPI0035B169FF
MASDKVSALFAAVFAAAGPAVAEPYLLPTPNVTVYPGEVVKDEMLGERDFGSPALVRIKPATSRAALVGKVARRTLLPGAAIPANAVAEPKVVANGAKVRVVYEQGGLSIAAYALALQDGGVGDVVSLRNIETGLVISGAAQADGSVRIGGE